MKTADGTDRAERPSFQQYAVGKRRAFSDAELVTQARAGDKFAYDALVLRHAPVVLGFLSARLNLPGHAEDLAQDVFLSAYAHLATLRDPDLFAAWVMRITQNRLTSYLRSHARNRETPVALDTPCGNSPADCVSDSAPTPAEQVSEKQTRHVVLEEIARLSEKYREVVAARLIREESTEEVAGRLNLTPEAARMRLLRGMEKLRKALQRRGIHSPHPLGSRGKVEAKP